MKLRAFWTLSLGIFSVLLVSVAAFIAACSGSPSSPAAPSAPAATFTFTPVISNTATNSPTKTPTPSITVTATNSPTSTPTSSPSNSPTMTPTSSPTNSLTPTASSTPTDSPTITITPIPTFTANATLTPICAPFDGSFGRSTFNSVQQTFGNTIGATLYFLSQPATVTNLSVYVVYDTQNSPQVQVAIYSDNGGTPNSLIVQSATQTLFPGWNKLKVADTPLNPGPYWLAVNSVSGSSYVYYKDTAPPAGGSLFVSTAFGSFPGTFPGGSNYAAEDLAIYAVFCPAPTYSPTPTGSATPTPSMTSTLCPTAIPTATSTSTGNDITGTINYTPGGVNASNNIGLLIFNLGGNDQPGTNVSTNGGTFDVTGLPAPTNYVMAFWFNTVGDGTARVKPHVGDYGGFLAGSGGVTCLLSSGGASVIGMPGGQVTTNVTFDNTSQIFGVKGTVTYSGSLGRVDDCHSIQVALYSDPGYSVNLSNDYVNSNGVRYDAIPFNSGNNDICGDQTVYLQAYYVAPGVGCCSINSGDPYIQIGPLSTAAAAATMTNLTITDAQIY